MEWRAFESFVVLLDSNGEVEYSSHNSRNNAFRAKISQKTPAHGSLCKQIHKRSTVFWSTATVFCCIWREHPIASYVCCVFEKEVKCSSGKEAFHKRQYKCDTVFWPNATRFRMDSIEAQSLKHAMRFSTADNRHCRVRPKTL